MTNLFSKLVDNLTEETCKVKCKYGNNNKIVKRVELNIKIVSVNLNTQTLKMI